VNSTLVIPVALPLAAALLGAGCEQRLSPGNIDVVNKQQEQAEKRPGGVEQVSQGLTMKEVEAVLGAPARISEGKIPVEVRTHFALTTWVYEQDGQSIELNFVDGKLQGKVPRFGEQLDPRAPLRMKPKADNE
jgi:hypothetical protein